MKMFEFEKKMNFDKKYSHMRMGPWFQSVLAFVWGSVGFVSLYIALKYVLLYIPEIKLWRHSAEVFYIGKIPFASIDFLYFFVGWILFSYGAIKLTLITRQNHSVFNQQSNKPDSLLTYGCYGKVRHPMYRIFIVLQVSILFSVRSSIGIILSLLVIIFQYTNAWLEEKKQLLPMFGKEYELYTEQVQRMILQRYEMVLILMMFALSCMGFIF